jgi:hypothetical protein
LLRGKGVFRFFQNRLFLLLSPLQITYISESINRSFLINFPTEKLLLFGVTCEKQIGNFMLFLVIILVQERVCSGRVPPPLFKGLK